MAEQIRNQIDDSEKMLPIGSLSLKPEIVQILKDNGFETFSDIQGKAIPKLLKGQSVLGLSLTGTGKTLSYALPIINDLNDDGHVQAVILSPTVALLDQIKDVLSSFLVPLGYPSDAIKIIKSNKDYNRAKPDILLTTPAMYKQAKSHYPFNELKRVIIDEGDMIAFDGFDEILAVLKSEIEKSMVSFFSASLNIQDVKRIKRLFHIQVVIDVRESSITNKTVLHHLVAYRGMDNKEALLAFLKNKTNYTKMILFVSKKSDLFAIDNFLKENKVKHLLVHGDMEKREINRAIQEFKKDENHLLLASDYASRGIDIPTVSDVVSFDLPLDLDYYFHRAGRSGRFNDNGDSYVFYSDDDEESVSKVKDLIRRGVIFDQYLLTNKGMNLQKGKYVFKNLGKKDQSNALLQKQIRHAVNKTKSKKVKPNYKKKVKVAVDRVKEKHRMKVVLTNISRNGGNVQDFHKDGYDPSAKKKKTINR